MKTPQLVELDADASEARLRKAIEAMKERYPNAEFEIKPHEGRPGFSCYGRANWTIDVGNWGNDSLIASYMGAMSALRLVDKRLNTLTKS